MIKVSILDPACNASHVVKLIVENDELFMVIVTCAVSFGHCAVPVITYWKVDVVEPAAGTKVPAPALNVPPVPVNLVHTPPACSPVIRFANVIVAMLLSHTAVLPSEPAFACIGVTVAMLVSFKQEAAPETVY